MVATGAEMATQTAYPAAVRDAGAAAVTASLRAARATAHAASGVAWQQGHNQEARLARSAEAAIDAALALCGLVRSRSAWKPTTSSGRGRRGRRGGGGAERKARDAAGAEFEERESELEETSEGDLRTATASTAVQTTRPLCVARGVQAAVHAPDAPMLPIGMSVKQHIKEKEQEIVNSTAGGTRKLKVTLSDPSTAAPDDCGELSELEDDEQDAVPALGAPAQPAQGAPAQDGQGAPAHASSGAPAQPAHGGASTIGSTLSSVPGPGIACRGAEPEVEAQPPSPAPGPGSSCRGAEPGNVNAKLMAIGLDEVVELLRYRLTELPSMRPFLKSAIETAEYFRAFLSQTVCSQRLVNDGKELLREITLLLDQDDVLQVSAIVLRIQRIELRAT